MNSLDRVFQFLKDLFLNKIGMISSSQYLWYQLNLKKYYLANKDKVIAHVRAFHNQQLAEKLKKDEATLSDSEKEEMLKKIQTLYQSIQLLSQQIQAKEQEVTQKLQADQAESVQKVVNELIKAKK